MNDPGRVSYALGLGISHDASAYLLADGLPVAGIQLERLTRVKHDGRLDEAHRMVEYVLAVAGIGVDHLDGIAINLADAQRIDGSSIGPIDLDDPSVLHVGHHLAHAFSAFGPSGFDRASVLVMDGNGDAYYDDDTEALTPGDVMAEQRRRPLSHRDHHVAPRYETESFYRFDRTGPTLLGKRTMGYGRAAQEGTSRWADLLGMGHHYGEAAHVLFGSRHAAGKLMGLAPHGQTSSGLRFHRISDGEIHLEEEWKEVIRRRLPGGFEDDFAFAAAVARDVQESTQEQIAAFVRTFPGGLVDGNLCLAGGVALNAITNAALLRSGVCERLYVQPASSDAGLAVGCAIAADWAHGGRVRGRQPPADSTGRTYATGEVEDALRSRGDQITWERVDDPAAVAAAELAAGRIVAWFDGGSEFGPRALGHRSFLGDPRRPDIATILNRDIKHRELFRPFAPSVLEEHSPDWFHPPAADRFMLTTTQVREDRRATIPGIVHVDGSARLQTVPPGQGPYRRLIEGFHERTGVPLVLDTSYNCGGEPMVESPEDAVDVFLRLPLDVLVIEGHVVRHRPGLRTLLQVADSVPVATAAALVETDPDLAVALIQNPGAAARDVARAAGRWGAGTADDYLEAVHRLSRAAPAG